MKYFQQLDISDCGAACLAMVASHYGVNLSITHVRGSAGTDVDGKYSMPKNFIWLKKNY